MFDTVRQHLNEIIELSDKCPDKYQVKCFEVLINSLLQKHNNTSANQVTSPSVDSKITFGSTLDFFSKYSISEEEWTKVYHLKDNKYSVIVSNLKEKAKAGKQIKLAMLIGVKNLLETRSPDILKDDLVELCKKYASYDSKNFAANIKNKKNYFLAEGKCWILTVPGQEKAAEVIKELAS